MKANFNFQPENRRVPSWGINPNDRNLNVEITKSYVKDSGSNNKEVRIIGNPQKEDADVKKSVANIIKWNSCIDETKIKISVEAGWVTLEGKVDLEFKRTKAELLAKDITGVKGVTNLLVVSPDLNS